VWKLVLGHTYNEHLVLVQKSGVTRHSCGERRRAERGGCTAQNGQREGAEGGDGGEGGVRTLAALECQVQARGERKGRSSTVAGTWWGVALTCGPWHGGKRETPADEWAPLRISNFKGFFQTRKVNEFEIRNKIAPVL
jgi:hypothetical protein